MLDVGCKKILLGLHGSDLSGNSKLKIVWYGVAMGEFGMEFDIKCFILKMTKKSLYIGSEDRNSFWTDADWTRDFANLLLSLS